MQFIDHWGAEKTSVFGKHGQTQDHRPAKEDLSPVLYDLEEYLFIGL